jgi:crossover junction endodeoxyribonuclease RusA
MTIIVPGIAAPQGSKRHVGNGRMVESCTRVKAWREAIAISAIEAQGSKPSIAGPVNIGIVFFLPRPKRAKFRNYPATRPDLDKLVRAIFDALTQARVWFDDGQVVEMHALKAWAGDDGPRVEINVDEVGQ